MGAEDRLGGVGIDAPAGIAERARDPGGLGGDLGLGQVLVAARGVRDHEVREHRAHDDPDDEQPPVELGVHGWVPRSWSRSAGHGGPGGASGIEALHAPVRIPAGRAEGRDAATLRPMPIADLSTAITALVAPILAAITFTPDPVAVRLGSIPIYWYGICYAIGLFLVYRVLSREARRRGFDARHVDNGIVIVAVAALIGGRLYHVIDQWQLYQNDPITAILPIARQPDGSYQFAGITGLGVYGGIATGTLAVLAYTRWQRLPFWRWADVIAPGAVRDAGGGALGELLQPGALRTADDPARGASRSTAPIGRPPTRASSSPLDTTAFHPLFLYESLSGVLGFVALMWLGRRFRHRLRPGDLLLIFFVWYAVVRFLLEFLRTDNWTLGGIPTAQIVSIVMVAAALVVAFIRHRPGWEDREEAAWIRDGWAGTSPGDEDEADWDDAGDGDAPDQDAELEEAEAEAGVDHDDGATAEAEAEAEADVADDEAEARAADTAAAAEAADGLDDDPQGRRSTTE